MINKIKVLANKIYKWFYIEVMCRKEPYTYQLCRQMIHHGIIFWIGFNIIIGAMYYIFFNLDFWWKILAGLVVIVLSWLTDHLIDSVRLNPERYND